MFGSKTSKPQSRIDCLIGAGTTIEGNLTFTGGLRVDGRVRGNVVAVDDEAATLVVSEEARIEGEIRVSHVVINGTVVGHDDEGPVYAVEWVAANPFAPADIVAEVTDVKGRTASSKVQLAPFDYVEQAEVISVLVAMRRSRNETVGSLAAWPSVMP